MAFYPDDDRTASYQREPVSPVKRFIGAAIIGGGLLAHGGVREAIGRNLSEGLVRLSTHLSPEAHVAETAAHRMARGFVDFVGLPGARNAGGHVGRRAVQPLVSLGRFNTALDALDSAAPVRQVLGDTIDIEQMRGLLDLHWRAAGGRPIRLVRHSQRQGELYALMASADGPFAEAARRFGGLGAADQRLAILDLEKLTHQTASSGANATNLWLQNAQRTLAREISGLPQFSMEQSTWYERLLGLQRASVQDWMDAETLRLTGGSRPNRALSAQLREMRGAFGTTDLSNIAAGPGVYRTASGELLNLNPMGEVIRKARQWLDESFQIPIIPGRFGLSPTRMVPWIPRERQQAVQLILNPEHVPYEGYSQGALIFGGKAFSVDLAGNLTERMGSGAMGVEAHGLTGRLIKALNAESPAEAWRRLVSPQEGSSFFTEMAGLMRLGHDPNDPKVAFRLLRERAAQGGTSEELLGYLRNVADRMKVVGRKDVAGYDRIILETYRRYIPSDVAQAIEQGEGSWNQSIRQRVLESVRDEAVARRGETLYHERRFLRDYNHQAEIQRWSHEQNDTFMGIWLENAQGVDIPGDEIAYAQLGELAVRRQLRGGGNGQVSLQDVGRILSQGNWNSEERALFQGALIDEFLGGRVIREGGLVAPSSQAWVSSFSGNMFSSAAEWQDIFREGEDLLRALRREGRWRLMAPDAKEWASSDPVLMQRGISLVSGLNGENGPDLLQGDWWKRYLRQFNPTLGRGNTEGFTTSSAGFYYLFERLNQLASSTHMGMGPESLGSVWDIWKNTALKRVLPLTAAGYYASYLTQLTDADNWWADRREQWSRGTIRMEEALGIRRLNQWMSESLPGFEYLREVPGLGGLLDPRTEEEFGEYVESGYDAVRSGRYWMGGSRSSFQGEKIKAWVPNFYRRARSDWQKTGVRWTFDEYWSQAPVPTPHYPLAPLRHYLGNYSFETLHAEDRPYPVSAPAFSPHSPWGNILNATVGRIMKPPRYHEQYDPKTGLDKREIAALWQAAEVGGFGGPGTGQGDILYGGGTGGGAGGGGWGAGQGGALAIGGDGVDLSDNLAARRLGIGLSDSEGATLYKTASGRYQIYKDLPVGGVAAGQSPGELLAQSMRPDDLGGPDRKPNVLHPQSLGHEAALQLYATEDLFGLYGFFAGALREKLGLPDRPLIERDLLEDPTRATEVSQLFWAGDYGGLPTEELGNELFRRFVPRERGTQRYHNPIRNEMPDWVPGPGSFTDFQHGDPYQKVTGGEYLLPGKAYEAIMGGIDTIIRHPRASAIGKSEDELVDYFLGKTEQFSEEFQRRVFDTGTAIHRTVQDLYAQQGRLVAAETPVQYDDITGHIDAILRNRDGSMTLLDIKSTGAPILEKMTGPKPENVEQVNFYLGAVGMKDTRGGLYYVDREDLTNSKQFFFDFDPEMFQESLAKVRRAQARAKETLEQSGLSQEDLYSPFERYKVLSLTAPYSDEYRYWRDAVRQQHRTGDPAITSEHWKEFKQLEDMVRERKKKKRLFTYRYLHQERVERDVRVDQVLGPGTFTAYGDPDRIYRLAGWSYGGLSNEDKENITAAAEKAGLYEGAKLRLVTDDDPRPDTYGTISVSAWKSSLTRRPTNVNRKVMELAGLESNDDKSTAGTDMSTTPFQRLVGGLWERAAHLDTYIHCLAPWTEIITDRGVQPASGTKSGDQVLARDGQWHRIVATQEQPAGKRIVDIHLSGAYSHRLTVTEDHPILAVRAVRRRRITSRSTGRELEPWGDQLRPEFILAGELRPDDYVVHVPRQFTNDSNPQKFDLGQLGRFAVEPDTVAAYCGSNHCGRRSRRERWIDITPELARLLGYYMAEGSIGKTQAGRAGYVIFSLDKSETALMEDIELCCLQAFGCRARRQPVRNSRTVHVVVGNCYLAELIDQLIGTRGEKRVPEKMLHSDSLRAEFIRGWLRGDGTKAGYQRYDFVGSVCVGALAWLRDALAHLWSIPSIVALAIDREIPLYGLSIGSYADFAGFIDSLRPYKADEQMNRRQCRELRSRVYCEGILLYRIKGIEESAYQGTTIDIEVEGEASFTTLNGTVHNTKFFKVRSPAEEWERGYVFGGNYGAWQTFTRDYGKASLWSLAGKDPVSAGIRGAFLGSIVFLPVEGRYLRKATMAARHTEGDFVTKAASWLSHYAGMEHGFVPRQLGRGYALGAMLGIGMSLYNRATSNEDRRAIPATRQRQFEIEEYYDKLKFVKETRLARMYDAAALEQEDVSIRSLLAQDSLAAQERQAEIRELQDRKREIYQAGISEENARERSDINKRLTELTGVRTAQRTGDLATRAYLHRMAASQTAYGADPSNYGEVSGAVPNYARQVLMEGAETAYDRRRIWQTLPDYLRAPLSRMYRQEEPEQVSLQKYFEEHSLPGEDWEGWQEDVELDQIRARYVKEHFTELNALEMGVWPQISREAMENIPADLVPELEHRNRPKDVKSVLWKLLNEAGYKVNDIRYETGAGEVDIRVLEDQDDEVLALL